MRRHSSHSPIQRTRCSTNCGVGLELLEPRSMLAAAGLLVSPKAINVVEGGALPITLKLQKAPAFPVTFQISCSDETQATVASSSVTFEPSGWSSPQKVVLRGVEDFVKDGKASITLKISAPETVDSEYAHLPARDLQAFVIDSKLTQAIVVGPAKITTGEGDGSTAKASFWIKLNGQPNAPVTIPLSSSNDAEGLPVVPSVTFTKENWNVKQKVFVRGVDDALPDGKVRYQIVTEAATSSDPRFDGVDAADVNVDNNPIYYASLYDGTYTGSFSGSRANGVIDEVSVSNGVVTVQIRVWSSAAGWNGEPVTGSGTVAKNGKFSVKTSGAVAGAIYAGSITVDPETRWVVGSGTWRYGSVASGSWQISRTVS